MKQNLLTSFAEILPFQNIEDEPIEYNHVLNLSVLKGTIVPAVTLSDQSTETMTKSNGEGTDSDRNFHGKLSQLADTQTNTFHSTESSDSDRGIHSILSMMVTRTITETVEDADSDK